MLMDNPRISWLREPRRKGKSPSGAAWPWTIRAWWPPGLRKNILSSRSIFSGPEASRSSIAPSPRPAPAKTRADVLNAFALKVLQERNFLQPYAAPEAAAYPAAYKDPKNFWVSMKNNYNVIGYNSRLVSPQEAPKNWEDLLHPRWKDKLGMDDEEYFWYAGMLKHWGEAKGKKYMEALAKQGIQWRNGHNLLVELMGAGEYPVSVVIYPERAEQLKAKGQTVEWVKTTDPILVNMDIMGIAAKAPHPNAAKLFFNYVLSKEAQMILHSRHRISARTDIPPLVATMEPKNFRWCRLIRQFRRMRASFGSSDPSLV